MSSTNMDDEVVFLWRKNSQGIVVEDTNGIVSCKKRRKILLEINLDDNEQCSICLQPIEFDQATGTSVSMVCSHTKEMHFRCLYEWYNKKDFPTCPIWHWNRIS